MNRLRRARARSVALASVLLVLVAVITTSLLLAHHGRPWFQGADDAWRSLMLRHRTALLVDTATVLAFIGSPWVTFPVRVAVAAVLVARRRWVQLTAFVVAMVVAQIAVTGLKVVVDRERPPGGLVRAVGASFPSGHAAAAAVTALGVVVAFLPRGTRRWHWIVVASTFATVMAWSRTYLSVHWASDTVAGASLGIAVALLTEAMFESISVSRPSVSDEGHEEVEVTRDEA